MTEPTIFSNLTEVEQRRRKQSLERAKANYLSSQLRLRLQYARLKVEHGWQRQNLNEVENLYFRHSHMQRSRPILPSETSTPGQSSESAISSSMKGSSTVINDTSSKRTLQNTAVDGEPPDSFLPVAKRQRISGAAESSSEEATTSISSAVSDHEVTTQSTQISDSSNNDNSSILATSTSQFKLYFSPHMHNLSNNGVPVHHGSTSANSQFSQSYTPTSPVAPPTSQDSKDISHPSPVPPPKRTRKRAVNSRLSTSNGQQMGHKTPTGSLQSNVLPDHSTMSSIVQFQGPPGSYPYLPTYLPASPSQAPYPSPEFGAYPQQMVAYPVQAGLYGATPTHSAYPPPYPLMSHMGSSLTYDSFWSSHSRPSNSSGVALSPSRDAGQGIETGPDSSPSINELSTI